MSATFGASLVISPALGSYMSEARGDVSVVGLATAVALLDLVFILVAVPESLSARLRQGWDSVTWETADPFAVSSFLHFPMFCLTSLYMCAHWSFD